MLTIPMTKKFWYIYGSLLTFYIYGMLIFIALDDNKTTAWSIITGVVAALFIFGVAYKLTEIKDD